jgi:predicted DNA-binding transcriptional regulator AlpA
MRLYEIGAATRADADRNVANDNWPLVLTRSQAAAVIGISVSTFDGWVRKGILPAPIAGTRRWSRVTIEGARAMGRNVQSRGRNRPALS